MSLYHNSESIDHESLRTRCSPTQVLVRLLFGCLFILSSISLVMSQEKTTGAAPGEATKKNTHSHSTPTKEFTNRMDKATISIPDLTVKTQNNQTRKFYTDLVKGKVVVFNFIYTSCMAICPLSGEYFAKLQTALGDRLGKDVFLVSVTTDPEVDSPQKLKEWSEKYKPKDGWTFVTGEKSEMTNLLMALTGEGPKKDFHTPIVLLVNDNSGNWIVNYSLVSPENILSSLEGLSANSPTKVSKH